MQRHTDFSEARIAGTHAKWSVNWALMERMYRWIRLASDLILVATFYCVEYAASVTGEKAGGVATTSF